MTKKPNANPEAVLRNLRKMINEAEETLSKVSEQGSSSKGSGSKGDAEEQDSPIKERMQSGFSRLRDYSSGVGDQVKDYYGEAGDRLRDYYEEAGERVRNGVETTNQTLSHHPYKMATVTFGLGMIAGALTRFMGKSR